MAAKLFTVRGRVQGVGFRYWVLREAQARGVAGWVRNLPDGSVEVLAAGEPGLVEAFAGSLWHGPPHARVSEVEARDAEAPGTTEFHVLPTPW